jgi:hypothetical protein
MSPVVLLMAKKANQEKQFWRRLANFGFAQLRHSLARGIEEWDDILYQGGNNEELGTVAFALWIASGTSRFRFHRAQCDRAGLCWNSAFTQASGSGAE